MSVELIKEAFGEWDDPYDMREGAMLALESYGSPGRNMLINKSLVRLLDEIETRNYESPLLVFDNLVLGSIVSEELPILQLEVINPSGKEGLLMGYPFFCKGGLTPEFVMSFFGVLDRGDHRKGVYLAYEIHE